MARKFDDGGDSKDDKLMGFFSLGMKYLQLGQDSHFNRCRNKAHQQILITFCINTRKQTQLGSGLQTVYIFSCNLLKAM